MKRPQMKLIVSATLSALAIAYGPVAQAVIYDGDDGPLLRPNISRTPDLPTEFSNVQMGKFYVPAQDGAGVVLTQPLTYTRADGSVVFTRTQAKPLVAAFNDGPVENPVWVNPVTGEEFEPAYAGHGKRDVLSAISFDDGATWRRWNLAQSASSVVGPIFVVNHTGSYVCDTSGLSGS
ncbi:MAG: hypothetical protein EHM37_01960, partial [Deltaproteobacteria bacterium]